ncbi:alkaline phosphatase family protein [Bradyrhizobium sp. 132]|uniref:alkaline phosphatase family protein n=1 Tax=unclassified Bradyrhizobium TaxID=2631580 RepID=UPI003211DCB6
MLPVCTREPDISSHDCGTGAPKTMAAISFVDRQLRRVLDGWEAEGVSLGVHLITASGHGHVTVHARADLFETLEAAGLRCGPAPAAGIDATSYLAKSEQFTSPSHRTPLSAAQ